MDIQFSARHFNASAGLQDRIQEEMEPVPPLSLTTKLNISAIAKLL